MSLDTIMIGDRRVGPDEPILVVAEVGQAHDGSLGMAHSFVDAIASTGADAIKFQTHIAEAESTRDEPFRIDFTYEDDSRFDYWRRTEFTREQWARLAQHARARGLIFLSSPFSLEAADLLRAIGMPAWKVGSGELFHTLLLDDLAKDGVPLLLSTGMATLSEVGAVVERLRRRAAQIGLLQCTTAYPTGPASVGLNVIGELRARFAVPVGLSDHSGTIYAGLAAAALGADIVEVHVAFSRAAFGPDAAASLTPSEIAQVVEGVAFIRAATQSPLDKRQPNDDLRELRAMFARSVAPRRDLPAGTRLAREDLRLKKPAGGIPPARIADLVGRELVRDVPADQLLDEGDLAP